MIFRTQREWKKWFAWFPVKLENGDWAWLQYLERRHYESMFYERWWIYREVA